MDQIDWLNTFHWGVEKLRTADPDALPVGSVLLDSEGVAWQRSFDGLWRSSLGRSLAPAYVAERGPLRLLHDASGGA